MDWRKIKKDLEWMFAVLMVVGFLAQIKGLWTPSQSTMTLLLLLAVINSISDALEE